MAQLVRNYLDDDFSSLMDLWETTEMSNKQDDDNQDVITETLDYGGTLLILEDDDKGVIGSSWITSDQRQLYMHHFCILPEFQKKGLSHMLMEKSMQFVIETGMQIKLEVGKENSKAKSIFKKYGFHFTGDYDVYIIRNPNDIKLMDL